MHLLIAAELVNAAKNQQTEKVAETRVKWYKNAEDIRVFDAIEDEALKMADYMAWGIIKQCFY